LTASLILINNGFPVQFLTMPAATQATQLSIYDIAEETGYTPAGIHKAIERLGIPPELITPGGVRYFSRLAVDKLKEHMRTKPKNGDS
jgi:hypothetical protein